MTLAKRRLLGVSTAALLSLTLVPSLTGQWQTVENDPIGISYRMPKRYLKATPLNKGQPVPNLVDKWFSVKPLYGKGGKFVWGIQIYAFLNKDKVATTGAADILKKAAKEKRELTDLEKLAMFKASPWKNFKHWLDKSPENRGSEFTKRAVDKKQRSGSRLPFRYYEWKHPANGSYWVHMAAVYEIGIREIAVVGHFPDGFQRKLKSTVKKAIESVAPFEGDARPKKDRAIEGEEYVTVAGDLKFTQLRKKLLADAKKPLKQLKDWSIFCTKNYIVLYAFDKGKKPKAYKFAKHLVGEMEEMHRQYIKRFKPHKGVEKWWSVLRICRNKQEFDRYGNTSGGTIGWFNPLSKELVVFNAKSLGLFKTNVVAFHEGWHQYAHFWFPGAHLHRWFDEGMGDFFGSMKHLGKNKWRLATSKMRKEDIRKLVQTHQTVPLKDIVRWHKDKFYGANASHYYAQGYSMVDFFIRGRKTPFWDKKWDHILDTYIKVALETKDTEKAVDEAFKGVDWDKLEATWKLYVRRGL